MEAAIVRSRGAAAALLHPERQRILEWLQQPNSASGLARRLGITRQRLNYHLKELEGQGLLELVEERKRGNCTERILRATATTYLLSPDVLGRLGVGEPVSTDRFSSAYLVWTAGRAIRDLALLREWAGDKPLATLTLETEIRFSSAAQRSAFATELANAFLEIAAKYHSPEAPEGRSFRVFAGAYPAPKEERTSNGQAPHD
jgi:DNA-binding transcriptional ArsR family regulator